MLFYYVIHYFLFVKSYVVRQKICIVKWRFALFQSCRKRNPTSAAWQNMGVKASSLMWCEYNGSSVLPREDKPSSYLYCYKVPPPNYNHNWTDLHYAASHGNVRRIHEIIHKTGIYIFYFISFKCKKYLQIINEDTCYWKVRD